MDWWKYRSRSPVSFPSKICKNHGRNGGVRASYSRSTMEDREAQNVPSPRRKKGYIYPPMKYGRCRILGQIIWPPGQKSAQKICPPY
jgi:hypothetical protein